MIRQSPFLYVFSISVGLHVIFFLMPSSLLKISLTDSLNSPLTVEESINITAFSRKDIESLLAENPDQTQQLGAEAPKSSSNNQDLPISNLQQRIEKSEIIGLDQTWTSTQDELDLGNEEEPGFFKEEDSSDELESLEEVKDKDSTELSQLESDSSSQSNDELWVFDSSKVATEFTDSQLSSWRSQMNQKGFNSLGLGRLDAIIEVSSSISSQYPKEACEQELVSQEIIVVFGLYLTSTEALQGELGILLVRSSGYDFFDDLATQKINTFIEGLDLKEFEENFLYLAPQIEFNSADCEKTSEF